MANAECDVLIVGAGTGGCAAAIAACSLGMRVIMTDESAMYGGQLITQLVPPDEHPWIEQFGCTRRYRQYRNGVRDAYRPQLTAEARANATLNPGGGWVSHLCHTPWAGDASLGKELVRAVEAKQLQIEFFYRPVALTSSHDIVDSVTFDTGSGESTSIRAKFVLDATELGDVLPLANAEYRVGSESQAEFGEPHATAEAEPTNVQGFTWCFPLGFDRTRRHQVRRPDDYDRWATYTPPGWPGPLLSFIFPNPVDGTPRSLPLWSADDNDRATLFAYRQIVNPSIYRARPTRQPVTAVNWPQNDYFGGSVIDVPAATASERLAESKALGRSLIYWLQTEAPRHDGGFGYPELMLRKDITLTEDGFAMCPYHRESRRMVTRFTITEPMVAADCNSGRDRSPEMPQSVGIGYYRIDLHPSANGRGYIDIPSLPFQLPLGALIPVRLRNLLPACKNLGVTHITNGCYRLHPVEWNLGEAAGLLAAFCVTRQTEPAAVYEQAQLWTDFQQLIHQEGIETAWPNTDLSLA